MSNDYRDWDDKDWEKLAWWALFVLITCIVINRYFDSYLYQWTYTLFYGKWN